MIGPEKTQNLSSFFLWKKSFFGSIYQKLYKKTLFGNKLTKLNFVWIFFRTDCAKKRNLTAGKSPFISPNKSIDNLIHPVMSMNPAPWHKSLWDNNDQTLTIINKGHGLTFYLLIQQRRSILTRTSTYMADRSISFTIRILHEIVLSF